MYMRIISLSSSSLLGWTIVPDRTKIGTRIDLRRIGPDNGYEMERSMDPVAIIIMLAIGAIAGWLAGQIIKGGGFGLVGNIVVGIAGALVAGFLFPGFLPFGGLVGAIISAAIGAIILLLIVGLIKRAT